MWRVRQLFAEIKKPAALLRPALSPEVEGRSFRPPLTLAFVAIPLFAIDGAALLRRTGLVLSLLRAIPAAFLRALSALAAAGLLVLPDLVLARLIRTALIL